MKVGLGTARAALIILSIIIGAARADAAGPEWAKFGEPGSPAATHRTIRITVTDTAFNPVSVTLSRGQSVTFKIRSVSSVRHEFVIGDAAFHARHEKEMAAMPDMEMHEANAVDIPPGLASTMTWRFTKVGDFIYACDVPGHAEAGMRGVIHVR